jgi:multidrug transporter EmrE-like cation transporter
MISYELGIVFGILAGVSNFLGQILLKKAINDTPADQRAAGLIKALIHNRTWLTGIIIQIVVCSVFMFLAQLVIGPALIPGLMASGFIVLAIGSVVILKEKLTAKEISSIILLLIAVVVIAYSRLSIGANLAYFNDANFNLRIGLYSVLFIALWLGLFYYGKNATKFKSIALALGTGFPFVLNNVWMGPFAASFGPIFRGSATGTTWIIFLIGAIVTVVVNISGLTHYQYALESGNASLIIPMQQLPQQVAPIVIYYMIYQFASPTEYSLLLLIIGIVFITISGFMLASRQAALEKIKG